MKILQGLKERRIEGCLTGECTHDEHVDCVNALADALREMDSSGEKRRGLYEKFSVIRTDGQSGPGGRHDGCRYFPLDLTHDKHAAPAIRAYALSVQDEDPQLAQQLHEQANLIERAFASANIKEEL